MALTGLYTLLFKRLKTREPKADAAALKLPMLYAEKDFENRSPSKLSSIDVSLVQLTLTLTLESPSAPARNEKGRAPGSFERNTRLGTPASARRRLSVEAASLVQSTQGVQFAPRPALLEPCEQSTQAFGGAGCVLRGQKAADGKHEMAPAALTLDPVQSAQSVCALPPVLLRYVPAGQGFKSPSARQK